MKQALTGAALLALTATTATAGGIERTSQSVAPIFEDGNYFEFSFGSVNPSVSGTAVGQASGNIAEKYNQLAFAYKHQFSDALSVALIYDQPFGADTAYPTGTTYPFTGATAELNTQALTALGRYKLDNGFSLHGGLRYQTIDANVSIPILSGYTAVGEKNGAVGYVVGAAYERPDIALRVALTYNSAIDHDISVSETTLALGGPNTTEIRVSTPQSVNLEAQTGIAKDTLLFGGVRWVEWSAFSIAPPDYATVTGGNALLSYASDTITYNLGIGRRFNENWSGSIALSHEKSTSDIFTNLGPVDGRTGITIGARYTKDNMTISGGINYTWLGDTRTVVSPVGPILSDFSDNTAVGLGFKVGFSF